MLLFCDTFLFSFFNFSNAFIHYYLVGQYILSEKAYEFIYSRIMFCIIIIIIVINVIAVIIIITVKSSWVIIFWEMNSIKGTSFQMLMKW